jgi:hypothetical protein
MKSWEYHDSILGSSLSANAKLTGLAIAYHYNWEDSRASFPSIAFLAKRTSLSRSTIFRSKKELVSQGYLVSTRRFNDSNLYVPQIPSQSQSETLVVSEGSTNNEYNYEVNNEDKPSRSYELLGSNNIIDLNQDKRWSIFENEERFTRPQPAGRGNRKPGKSNRNLRRNNQDITGVAESSEGFDQEATYRMGGEW